jgi:DNA polymerase-3 subunit gamma/tau
VESPLALYRRYRPETFAEVIGQDHVTEPLRAAITANRVNHAYLFSGPRGCGKTTSARILARALNCHDLRGSEPCGSCPSCTDLARGGPGSIDVIEIDAASHGGVDDARDLREKAFFAPVRDRYKVYIIDEAHMVTTQGFNALLKLVEEPPPHLRFIFATTEPEKVIATIRSRTHHYPFRLIPPRLLTDYLSQLCEAEGVAIEPAALPLVVRAGGGSARDTLSVLDQLLGGAGPDGVTHKLATDLLGFTPDTLLDEVVEAFASRDGGAVFSVVDKVVETGQDPRRFTEDLLRRLRDLVIVTAVPDAPATGLIDVPEDAGERLVAQAARFGAIELSRAADIVAAGLTEMRGATAPRLLLELLCARVLLPGADHTSDGVMARLERLERRLDMPGGHEPAAAPQAPAPPPPAQQAAAEQVQATEAPPAPPKPSVATPSLAPTPAAGSADSWAPPPPPPPYGAAPAQPAEQQAPQQSAQAPAPPAAPQPSAAEQPADHHAPASTEPVAEQPGGPRGGLSLVDVRRLWPDLLEGVKSHRRLIWMVLSQNAHVVAVDATTLTVGFTAAGPRDSFVNSGGPDVLRDVAIDKIGMDWRVEAIVDPGATPADTPVVVQSATRSVPASTDSAPERSYDDAPAAPEPTQPAAPVAPAVPQPSAAVESARQALSQAQAGIVEPRVETRSADDDVDPDDPDADTGAVDSAALLQQALGAELIDEIDHT